MNYEVPILIADDDADDRYLIQSAFEECAFTNPIHFVENGQELLDYLLGQGRYAKAPLPLPGIILLDLNMPKKDGRTALREIKEHPSLRSIPIIIMTTSKADTDIQETYIAGANSFITKPIDFEKLLRVVTSLGQFWFETARIPSS